MPNTVDFFAINAADVPRARKFYEAVFDGGRIAAPKFHIPNVGTIAYFFDTEGNVAGIRQPETTA